MSITVKLADLNHGGTLQGLQELKRLKLPFRHSFNIMRILKQIDEVIATTREEYLKISQEFGEVKTVEGKDQPEFVFHEGKTSEDLEQAGKDFLMQEIEIQGHLIPASILEAHKMSVETIISIEAFIDSEL